ncbi:MAG: hypothetical protein BGN88_09865 [Clostridiales bacterium 43-6]|nr:MAG: hypothetical protein BGN88_09865 [Clostridiales bacterium 43-6]
MIINNLVPSSFINNLGYYLNCYDRQIACVMNSVILNSMFYLILFKDLEVNFNGDNVYELIKLKTGLEIKKNILSFNNIEEFNNTNSLLLKNQKNVFLKSDLFYDKRYYNCNYTHFYNKIHHSHYIILNGYNKANNLYYIIDEDPCYINKSKRTDKWPYVKLNILDHELFNISTCKSKIDNKFSSNYTEVINKNIINTIELKNILELYNSYIVLKNNLDILENNLFNSLDNYLKGNDFCFSYGKYPKALHNIRLRNDQVNIIYRFYKRLYFDKPDVLNKLDQEIIILLKLYKKINMSLVKFALDKDAIIGKDVYKELKDIMYLEKGLLYFQIKMLDENNKYNIHLY